MKTICYIVLISCLFTEHSFGQQKKVHYNSAFETEKHGWFQKRTPNEIDKNICSVSTKKGQYFVSSDVGAYIPLPSRISEVFDSLETADLDFNWQLDQSYNNDSLLLVFEIITDGGKAMNKVRLGVQGVISSSYLQGKIFSLNPNNNNYDIGVQVKDKKVPLYRSNSIRISKQYGLWLLFVNGEKIVEFFYPPGVGEIHFHHFVVSGGIHNFTNFVISSKQDETSSLNMLENQDILPTIRVLLVGVEKYENENVQPLRYTVDDALAMYRFWKSSKGGKIKEDNIILLRNEQATIRNILKSAENLFKNSKANDLNIVYLAGHGDFQYFLAVDQELAYESLVALINESQAKNKLFIVDACRVDMKPKEKKLLFPKEALAKMYQKLGSIDDRPGFLFSCSGNEMAQESEEIGHGIFTHHLLNALNDRNVDYDNDRIITIREAYTYLQQQFSIWNNGKKYQQHPYLSDEVRLGFPLANY
ncbi:MAG: caspase family protein [Candidatus Kapabacteria bacterium]|jgi:hypothetical protein|nr:caspase family protein [Candidatus Kapabacteria bacterium]